MRHWCLGRQTSCPGHLHRSMETRPARKASRCSTSSSSSNWQGVPTASMPRRQAHGPVSWCHGHCNDGVRKWSPIPGTRQPFTVCAPGQHDRLLDLAPGLYDGYWLVKEGSLTCIVLTLNRHSQTSKWSCVFWGAAMYVLSLSFVCVPYSPPP